MKAADSKKDEPVGIVIRGGTQPVQSSVFIAYEWGPAPTTSEAPKAA